ncbi:hypothetical protein MMC19_006668 [Ptychographa xylographoides]|nr:hypothetical protein [Ptychographa xylographoides]
MAVEERPQEAVTVSVADLKFTSSDTVDIDRVPFEILEEAFGPSSLGILIVKDLPNNFAPLREKVLSYASYLADLSPDILESLSIPEAKYLVGWSHGKEALKTGQYDTLKGSYYINCAFYQDPTLQNAPADDFPNFPEYTAPNVWPPESALAGFRKAVEELCTLIIDTAVLVAKACDRYAVANIEAYEPGYLERVVKTSLTTKARLLHYFPAPPSSLPSHSQSLDIDPSSATESAPSISTQPVNGDADGDDDSWCATHLDHGCLTGLTSALYINESAPLPVLSSSSSTTSLPALPTLPTSPDPRAGLYIRSRAGHTTKVNIPATSLAFQTGEALEVITRGKFRAVPHFVRGPEGEATAGMSVARNTLAVFTQPNLGEVVDVDTGVTFGEFARGVVDRHG